MERTPVLRMTERGLYCEAGEFYIDPWMPVDRAVVTHAHGDHLVRGCRAYLFASPGEALFKLRLDEEARLQPAPYRERISINGVTVSLHPAGHLLGSAQVRVEQGGEVWVVSGDYKLDPDPTCEPFELVRCHSFITEATFGLPIYRWPHPETVFEQVNAWWRANQAAGKASVLYAYALGKSQRILAGIDETIGPIYTHGAVQQVNSAYRRAGIPLPPAPRATTAGKVDWTQALILAPTSARATPWLRRFGVHASAFASGWMRVRGNRRRRAMDRGFVISDHVDWPGLMQTVMATGAEQVWVTHGYTHVVARWLQEQGIEAAPLETPFEAEIDDAGIEEE